LSRARLDTELDPQSGYLVSEPYLALWLIDDYLQKVRTAPLELFTDLLNVDILEAGLLHKFPYLAPVILGKIGEKVFIIADELIALEGGYVIHQTYERTDGKTGPKGTTQKPPDSFQPDININGHL